MAIPDYRRRNFATLLSAGLHGHLALVECTDAATGEPRYVICAIVAESGDGGALLYVMTPFGHLCEGDPYISYVPSGEPRE